MCFAAGSSIIVATSGGIVSTGGDVAVVAGCRVDVTDNGIISTGKSVFVAGGGFVVVNSSGIVASGNIVAVDEELKVIAADVLQAAAFKGSGDAASGSI